MAYIPPNSLSDTHSQKEHMHPNFWLGSGGEIFQTENAQKLYSGIAPTQLQPDPLLQEGARVAIRIMVDLVEVDYDVEDLYEFFSNVVQKHTGNLPKIKEAVIFQFSNQLRSVNNISNYFNLDTTIYQLLLEITYHELGTSVGTYKLSRVLCSGVGFDKTHAGTILTQACVNNNISVIPPVVRTFPTILLDDPTKSFLSLACSEGSYEVCRFLLSTGHTDPSEQHNYCIVTASRLGYMRIVRLLLRDPRTNPGDRRNMAIVNASREGFHHIVQLLLTDPRVDPNAQNSQAILSACINNHLACVRILVEDGGVDPWSSESLQRAARYGRLEVVKFLLTCPGLPMGIVIDARRIARECGRYRVLTLLSNSINP